MILQGISVKSDSTVDLGKIFHKKFMNVKIVEDFCKACFTEDCDVMSEKIHDPKSFLKHFGCLFGC